MADERLRLVAEVADQFTGPLDKLNTALRRTASTGTQTGKDLAKDFEGFHGTLGKATSALQGMLSPLQSLGVVGLGAGLGLGGIATALRSFSSGTQQLTILSKETGLAVNELRAFGALGERFGATADTMQGGVKRFSDEMSQLRRRYGEAYSGLQAMNLGELVEKLVNASNMKAALDAAMDALSNIGDPVKRRKIAEMLFGTDQIGAVAGQVTGKYQEMMKEIQASIGSMSKETEKAAADFEKNMSRMGNAAERLKLNTLGPLLKGLNTIVESGDRNGIRGNAEAMAADLGARLTAAVKQRDSLASDPVKNAEQLKSLEKEIRNLTDTIRRSKDGAGPSGVSAIPMSYSGGGGGSGGAKIYNASYGGGGGGFGGGGGYAGGGFGGFGDLGPPLNPRAGGSRGDGGVPPVPGGSYTPPLPQDGGALPPAGGYTGNDGRRASRSGMSAAGRANVASWMDFFRKPVDQGGMGYTEEQARGQIAMMQGESGLNLDPGAMGDKDRRGVPHAFGTVQWSDAKGNDRFPRLRALAAERGTAWQDRATQQEMYRREMMGRYKGVYNRIRGAQTGEQSLWAGIVGYENPQQHSLAFGIRTPFLNRLRRDGAGSAVAGVPPGDENGNFPNGAPRALKPRSMAGDASVPGQVAEPGGPAAGTRTGDAMMRRLYGDQAPVARGAGKGTLHIEFSNPPAGMRPRASMDDLFSSTTISKQRQLELRGENV